MIPQYHPAIPDILQLLMSRMDDADLMLREVASSTPTLSTTRDKGRSTEADALHLPPTIRL
jgi:hypothetical protein